jgi:hypothetical protein
LGEVVGSRAKLCVIRAEPGHGGTRLLAEVEEAERPRRSLRLCTAGAEPLGSLRYAFARSIAVHGPAPDGALSETELQALEDLLAGEGIDDDLGAAIVARWTLLEGNAASGNAPGGSADNREPADVAGVVLIDDATEIDDPSLDVVAKAAVVPGAPVRIVMRLDGGSLLPPSFDKLPAGPQILLPALEPDDALALASELAPVPLTAEAAATWAERGRHVPLGIAEAIALGRGTGAFEASGARASFAPDTDLGLDATEWIRRRYDLLSNDAKMVLRACAVLGLDVEKALLHELVELGPAIATAAAMQELVAEGWLEERAGYCTFASRTHREVVSEDVVDDEEKRLHGSASILVEKRGGKLAAAEAARHAAMAGDHPRSVELALAAAEMSRVLGLDGACEALLAFVGANPHGFAALPTPTTVFRLESWIEALRASGEHDGAASRLEAIALLAKGETGAALAALRDGVTQARSSSAAMRSRAALAYGIGLAVAGQPTEALFTALEALARAREGGEARGERACARFLTRLCEGAGRGAAAATWQNIAGERTIPPPRGSMPPPRA